jgi:drug/metabolite transporter, DME family
MDGTGRLLVPRLLVACAAFLWATTGLAGLLVPTGLSAATLGAARLLLGGALMFVSRAARLQLLAAGRAPGQLALACASLAAFQWSYFEAVAIAGNAAAAIVSAVAAPLASAALQPAARWWQACASMLGLAIAFVFTPYLTGFAFAAVNGIAYACYAEVAARMERAAAAPGAGLAITAAALLGAGATLLPFAAGDAASLLSRRALLVMLYLGLFTSALAYALFVIGLRKLAPSDALATLALQPLLAAGLDYLFLGAHFSGWLALASLTPVAGVLVYSRPTHGSTRQ